MQGAAQSVELKLVDDMTLYTSLVLSDVNGAVIDGNGYKIIGKLGATNESAIILNNAALTLNNIVVEHAASCPAINVQNGTELTIGGASNLTAANTVIEMSGFNSTLTVTGSTVMSNSTSATASDALIHTVGGEVLIESGSFEAKGSSATVCVDASAPEKLTVAVVAGAFASTATTPFVNKASLAVMIVATNGSVTVNGTAITNAASEESLFSNAGYGNFGEYNDLVELPEMQDVIPA